MTLPELGAWAVRQSWWRWMRGMTSDRTPPEDDADAGPWPWLVRDAVCVGPLANGAPRYNKDRYPDLTDPATVGCLYALAQMWEVSRG